MRDKLDEVLWCNHRRKQLYNRKYRRTLLFRLSWLLRVLYIVLAILAVLFHEIPNNFREEVVTDSTVNEYDVPLRRGGIQHVTELRIHTTRHHYQATAINAYFPSIKTSDTLLIERNLLGKPNYFSKKGWYLKYPLDIHYVYYVLVLLVTLTSMGFNDGLDRFTTPILIVSSVIHVVAILLYFFC